MLKEYDSKKIAGAFLCAVGYSFLSVWYFLVFDIAFYVKNVLNCGFSFAIPLPYIALTAVYIFFYSRISGERARAAAYPITAMAVMMGFFYLLADLKAGLRTVNPFGGDRGIYGAYADIYISLLLSAFAVLCGYIFRTLSGRKTPLPFPGGNTGFHNIVFHIPLLVFFISIETMLFMKGLSLFAAGLLAVFAFSLFSGKIPDMLRKAASAVVWFVNNEKLLLITIFLAAFAVRCLWGFRLLGLTGERFVLASDDGGCYDIFAATISGGGLLAKGSVYEMGGFGYWYFLAAIYKIFGPHNFKAMIAIQALIGSSVPVFTYFIAKRVFGGRMAPVVAGIMACADMTLIFLSVVIGMEAVYIPFVLLALTAAVYLFGADYKKAFIVGAAFGLAYNFRPPELLLFPPILALILCFFAGKTIGVKKAAGAIASLFIGFIMLISVQYTVNFLIYKVPPALQGAVQSSFDAGKAEGGHTGENKMLGEMGFSPFKDPKGSIAVLAHSPGTVLSLVAKGFCKRFAILCFIPNFGVFDPTYLINPGSGYFFRFPVYVQCCGYLLVVLGIFAALRIKKGRMGTVILFAFLLYMASRVAFFFILNSRYRGVLLAVFFIFFAYGLKALVDKVRKSYCGSS